MRVLLLLSSFILFLSANAQKVEFGVSIQGGIPMVSDKEKTIQMYNANHPTDIPDKWMHPKFLWSTRQIDFSLYLNKPKNLSLSLGVRMFKYGWEVDTIGVSIYIGSFNPPTGYWEAYYARRESKLGFVLPTISLNYDFELSKYFWLKNSISFGITSFMYYNQRKSFAYDGGQDAFDYLDQGNEGSFSGYFDKKVNDFQLQSAIAFEYGGFSIFVGPSLYYISTGLTNYTALKIDTGLSYRFRRKEK